MATIKSGKNYWENWLNQFVQRRGQAKGYDASVYNKGEMIKFAKEIVAELKKQFSGTFEVTPTTGEGTMFGIDGYFFTLTRGTGKQYKVTFLHGNGKRAL